MRCEVKKTSEDRDECPQYNKHQESPSREFRQGNNETLDRDKDNEEFWHHTTHNQHIVRNWHR